MKKVSILVMFFALSLITIAQEVETKPEQQTLFGNNEKPSLRAFIGFNTKGILLDDQFGLLTGGSFEMVFNHKLNIGFFGQGMINNVNYFNPISNQTRYYNLALGGIKIEPVLFSYKSSIHLTFPINFGAGAVSTRGQFLIDNQFDWEDSSYDLDGFVFVEPCAGVEFNLLKHVRLAANVGYMFTDNVYLSGNLNRNLNSFSGNISLRIGWF